MLEERLNQDLKTALLEGDIVAVNTLRGLKSAILYAKVASGTRSKDLPEDVLFGVLQKEAKKRQESIEAYRNAGNEEKAQVETREREIIERYLPSKLTDEEVAALVDKVIAEMGGLSNASMGMVINSVKQRTAGAADGALIAHITKERLQK